jgi:hypothetical protein
VGLTVTGWDKIKANIARTEQKAQQNSLAALRAMAKLIVTAARANAPIDEGDLESAIVSKEVRERTAGGQFGQTTIQVGVDTSLLDLESRKGFDYSVPMHEGDYNLGPRSMIKQSFLPGVTVGSKYLERAIQDNQNEVRKRLEAALRGIL